MDIKRITAACDHTLLSKSATKDDIKKLCDDAVKYECASVCIAPCHVWFAKEYLTSVGSDVAVCTVIGFPNGYSTSAVKIFEAKDAVNNGADEIDMVINIGMLKEKEYDALLSEISEIKKACKEKILKVIIETCLLTDDEIVKMCEIVSASGADFIKTSTGFDKEGATFHAVELMSTSVANGVRVKAAGGISSLEDAEHFLEIGASRLGTSRVIKILENENSDGIKY